MEYNEHRPSLKGTTGGFGVLEGAKVPTGRLGHLSAGHRLMLFEGSGISPGVASERGYYTARSRSEVPEAFAGYQRRLGLVVPMFSPDGITRGWQLRPDKPRKKGPKYVSPSGVSPVVDVHPRMLEEVRAGDGPLLVTEGAKTGDAATSRGIPTVVLAGVWMWCVPKVRPYRLKPCFDHVRLVDREVLVAFDSDCMTKEGVQEALAALVAALEDRGAVVKVIYLPDAQDGSKQGVDDYLVAGGTIKEMFMLARKFEPADVGRIRLSRDERLRPTFDDLERRHSETVWCWSGADADSNIYQALAAAALRHGKIHADGVRVAESYGALMRDAKIGSSRTISKGLGRLEEQGLLYRDNEGREEGKSGAFVLMTSVANATRAGVKHLGGSPAEGEKATESVQRVNPTTLHPRSPRLWASSPRLKPTKKMIREHRLGTRSYLPEPREAIKRVGKRRSRAFDWLDAAGGSLDRDELGELLGIRPRDLTRRKTSPKGRDGLLVEAIEAGIVAYEAGVVALTDDWRKRLEEQREKGDEGEADKWAERRRERRSAAYRVHLAELCRGRPAASKPSAAGLAAVERSHRKRADNIAEHDAHQASVDAAEMECKRFAKRFVHDRMKALGRIRLELLQEVLRDAGGTPSYALPAAKSLGCTVERLPEYGDREFVFAPREWAA